MVAVGVEVFQNPPTGEYSLSGSRTLPDEFRCFSQTSHVPENPNQPAATIRDATENKSFFTVYYQNVRGLRTKTKDLRLLLSSCDYDILVFTETWLRSDICDSELSSEYCFFRRDRSELTSEFSRGGGVLVAVKINLQCTSISLPDCNHLEQVAVRVNLPTRSVYVCSIYLRPNSSADLYLAHSAAIDTISDQLDDSDVVIVLGDYNLPYLTWQLDEDLNGYIPINASSEQELALTESLLAYGLLQVNRFTNTNERLLDLAFVNAPDDVEIVEPPLPLLPVDPHHKPFIILLDVLSDVSDVLEQRAEPMVMNFKRCDFEALNNALASIDWRQYIVGDSVDLDTSTFYGKLFEVLDVHVPRVCRAADTSTRKPWWTAELRHMRNTLRKMRKRFFKNRTMANNNSLRDMEASYKNLLSETYSAYMRTVQEKLKQNPTSFWKYVKSLKASPRIPTTIEFDGTTSSTATEASNLFARFFQSVYNTTTPATYPGCFQHVPVYDINLPVIQMSTDEVQKALEDVDVSKGAGVDGLPPLFLKHCASSLAFPVACLFNQSLAEKTFPAIWKTARIVPIHKSGSTYCVKNYRGISILCSLGKVFESMVQSILYRVAQPLISEHQHGFVKHRSTTTNLMCYTSVLFKEIEGRNQIDSIYVDFSKAFDVVPHDYAVEKLKYMGFPEHITGWLHSYLTDRKASVSVNSVCSREFTISSGVPQGSVLGPLIFILFVNDVCFRLKSPKQMFADDLKFYRVISSVLDCLALQNDIDELLMWCHENGMKVNVTKCKVISFTRRINTISHPYSIGSDTLERVNSIRDLGVTIDSKLRFHEHISSVGAKAFAVLGFIRRHSSYFTDVYTLKTLFCTLVRSILEYAVQIWAPYHVVHDIRLERVQKQFIRYALRQLPWNDPENLPDYPSRCMLISLDTLSTRRLKLQQIFVFDLMEGNIDCPELLQQINFNVPPRAYRSFPAINLPFHRTSYGRNCPLSSCLRAYNDVSSAHEFGMTKNAFKTRIRDLV